MKKYIFSCFIFLSVFCLLSSLVSPLSAQSPASTVTVSYPVTIPDVGTCNSWAECHKLCADPINKTACYNWGVGTKIIKPSNAEALTQAMQDLKCTSKETCAVYCTDPTHKEACLTVGKKYNLLPDYEKRAQELVRQGQTSPVQNEITRLATENKMTTDDLSKNLQTVCSKKENAVRCGRIADGLGIQSSTPAGPGGCQTTETCRKYCDNPDNFAECNSFGISGPQGCTSELSCFQACQSGGCTDTTRPSIFTLDPSKPETVKTLTNLSQSCGDALKNVTDQTLLNTVGTLKNTGVCELYDTQDTAKNTSAKDCATYLDENSAKKFNATEFSQYCASLPVLPKNTVKTTNTNATTQQSNVSQLDTTCTLLKTLGITSNPYSIMANNCTNTANTVEKARADCSKPTSQRTIVKTEEDERKYCLSAPADMTDYKQSCTSDKTNCQSGGYDWYCKKNPTKCIPLIEGQSVSKLTERFTNGINAVSAINALNAVNAADTLNAINAPKGASGTSGGYERTKTSSTQRNFFGGMRDIHYNWDVSPANKPVTGQSTPTKNVFGWASIPLAPPVLGTPNPGEIRPTLLYRPPVLPTTYVIPNQPPVNTDQPVTTQPKIYPTTYNVQPTTYVPPTYISPTKYIEPTRATTTTNTQPTTHIYPTPTTYIPPQQPSTYIPPPTEHPITNAGTGTTGTTYISPTPHPTVQGISDTKNWWQVILEYLGAK